MASGRVCTGFSFPFVAVYSASGTTVTYSGGMELARGVEVNFDVSAADDNKFYANNTTAESESGKFSSGSVTLTVDGLKNAARNLIYGITQASSTDYVDFDDDLVIPYVGFGCVIRWQSDGVTTYEPMVLPKIRFAMANTTAKTQEENIEWQTQELTASIERDDTAKHKWKREYNEESSEADAVAVLKTFLSIT